MPENKITRIEIRVTEKEKEQIKQYTKKNNITISQLFRKLIIEVIQNEQK